MTPEEINKIVGTIANVKEAIVTQLNALQEIMKNFPQVPLNAETTISEEQIHAIATSILTKHKKAIGESIMEDISFRDIADEMDIDYNTLGQYIDASEVAKEFEISDLAAELVQHIDYDNLALSLYKHIIDTNVKTELNRRIEDQKKMDAAKANIGK